jgi:hypothetical protein
MSMGWNPDSTEIPRTSGLRNKESQGVFAYYLFASLGRVPTRTVTHESPKLPQPPARDGRSARQRRGELYVTDHQVDSYCTGTNRCQWHIYLLCSERQVYILHVGLCVVDGRTVTSTIDPISSAGLTIRLPRPKPRPAYKGAPGGPSNVVESSFIDSFSDAQISSSLSERVKMRNRFTSKAPDSSSSSRRPAIASSEIIDIDDSDDELISNHKSSKATSSKSKVSNSSSSSNLPMPSPYQRAAPRTVTVSQLPPSDPFPHSTGFQPQQQEEEEQGSLPPIATLTAAGDTSFDVDSSPSRLVHRKERPKPRIKPKKPKQPAGDEMLGEGGNTDAHLMPPPFASLPPVAGTSAPDPLPELLASIGAPPSKPPPKKRKKQGGEEGDLNEKPAKKPRAKKAKKDQDQDQEVGEQAQDKPKAKRGKGKEKEKEVFKSAEFILDDEDDALDDPLALPLPGVALSSRVPADKPPSVISIPDSQAEEELVSVPVMGGKGKRKRVVEDDEDDGGYAENSASSAKKGKKAKTAGATVEKFKKNAPAKKAKGRTVLSDDEEDGLGDAPLVADPDSVADEFTTAPPAQDGEEDVKTKPAKKKQAKKAVPESDAEEDAAFVSDAIQAHGSY